MILEIVRVESGENGTFGMLKIDGESRFLTLEPEWKDNKKFISCIPAGDYKCSLVDSPRFGTSLQIKDVKDRTNILFHAGNSAGDTDGCVLLGRMIHSRRIILKSGPAVAEFRDLIVKDRREIDLSIRNCWSFS